MSLMGHPFPPSVQVLHLTPLADAQIPATSWAIASAYAPATLHHQWQTRSLTSLRGFTPPQLADHAKSEQPLQGPTATVADSPLSPVECTLTAADAAARAEAEPPDPEMQVRQAVCRNVMSSRPSTSHVPLAVPVLRCTTPVQQADVAAVMDALASRARMHLMNQHSAKATFSPRCCGWCCHACCWFDGTGLHSVHLTCNRGHHWLQCNATTRQLCCSDLTALAGSFALMGHYSGDVSQALDAVLGELRRMSPCRLECDTLPLDAVECGSLARAGFARRRIDARHLNAVSRLDHTAQVHSMGRRIANAVYCQVTKRQSWTVL